jgi:hypothetical protein
MAKKDDSRHVILETPDYKLVMQESVNVVHLEEIIHGSDIVLDIPIPNDRLLELAENLMECAKEIYGKLNN